MAVETSVTKPEAEKPWHAAFPEPQAAASPLNRKYLLSWLQKGKVAGKDFVLVDLRRTDFEGGTIQGSINLPAQSLYDTIPTLYILLSNAGINTIIWYCSSSRGRGNRAAGWFGDYIKQQNNTVMENYVLEGGVKGWATAGEEYVKLMDGYDVTAWQ